MAVTFSDNIMTNQSIVDNDFSVLFFCWIFFFQKLTRADWHHIKSCGTVYDIKYFDRDPESTEDPFTNRLKKSGKNFEYCKIVIFNESGVAIHKINNYQALQLLQK